MKEPGTGKSRGFGFLTFVDPSVVDGVIDPKRAIPREEQDKTEKIFVGGIAPEVTEDEFKDYFSQFGHVIDATLMTDRETGRPRGFGFITFESDKGVEEAMKRTDLAIRDKQIEVKKAMPKHKAHQARMMQNITMSGSIPPANLAMSGLPTGSAMSAVQSMGYDPRAAYAAAAMGRGYGMTTAGPSANAANSRYSGAAAYGVAAGGGGRMDKNAAAMAAAGYDSRYATAYGGYGGYGGYGNYGYGSYGDYSRRGYDPTTTAMAAYYNRGYGYGGYGTGTGTGWGAGITTGTGRGAYGYSAMTGGRSSSGYDAYSSSAGYGGVGGAAGGAAAGAYGRGYGRDDSGYGQSSGGSNGGSEFGAVNRGNGEGYDRRVSGAAGMGGGVAAASRPTATSPGGGGGGPVRSGSSGPSGGSSSSGSSGGGRAGGGGGAGFQAGNGNGSGSGGGGGAIHTTQAVRNLHNYHPYLRERG
ncbi:hypothetical protein BC936DRAFT_145008 [Jimgerdemannia flammicorona]|uniref:RRM domain-containing protein n=1 Tax=Jimgerdemannia flammicorona TaxID=994334 RepID=A0A433DB57_9FUNG|nr:hypothetical protein BC936DRAFT_145008 [Jimgerdemannia flammicorona]